MSLAVRVVIVGVLVTGIARVLVATPAADSYQPAGLLRRV